jgi:hypothetical protein
MKTLFRSRTIAHLALAWALIALLPMCLAQNSHTLDKHARKVYKTLSRYPTNTYLHLQMRDGTDLFGTLGTMKGASFGFVDSDNNATETIAYDSVDRVRHDAQTVSEGDYPHPHRHLLPALLIGAVAGAGAAVYFTYIH